ncbi:MAG TPA: HAD-IC family P-type ATPase [Acidimicrobiia bacterium]
MAEVVASPPAQRTPPTGLSAEEVAERVARGATNHTGARTSRTLREIARANIFTRFNAILGAMLVVTLALREPADSLFGIVLVVNALIGIVQEYLAKRKLDALAVLNAPRARVMRDGHESEIAVDDVVLDDVVELASGDQVCADGSLLESDGLELDESLLTGESDPVDKADGDEVLSGSFVVAGHGRFQATRVGSSAYAQQLASEARRFSLVSSELQAGTDEILKYVTIAMVPCAALLLWSQLNGSGSRHDQLIRVVAGIVAMVPEGLVLLTSLAFLIAARLLAQRRVLVQELPAVEGLARVDVVCIDKTGTITEGVVDFHSVVPLGDHDESEAAPALGALAADEHANATLRAVRDAFDDPGWHRSGTVPFSSARKWSAVQFADHGSWYVGAPEMLWTAPDGDGQGVLDRAHEHASAGRRVLLLAHTDEPLAGEARPETLDAVALVLLEERVRADAADTFRYFDEQGVKLRVISGDSPATVAAVAARAGIPGADRVVDVRTLPDDLDQLADALEDHVVFGRVAPQQKRAIVQALQSRGHVVAMTGDGVNDALALKDADIGVAMGNGAAATRSVAQIVLLDGQFGAMPGVVAEGRRVIANVERVANLYITKTVYAVVFAVVVGVASWTYPFVPRHMTVVSSLTIGIPSFFLALAPSNRRYVPGFVHRVARFTIPAGLTLGIATLATYGIVRQIHHVTDAEASSVAIVVLVALGLWVLLVLARPLTVLRVVLVALMALSFVVLLLSPALRNFYEIELTHDTSAWVTAAIATAAGVCGVELTARLARVTPQESGAGGGGRADRG